MTTTTTTATDTNTHDTCEIASRFGLLDLGAAACPRCGTVCDSFRAFGQVRYDCLGCAAAEKARRVHEVRRLDCVRLWWEVTPPEMQVEIDRERLGEFVRPALELDGTEGAGLAGGSGSGKSRVAYVLLKRAALRGLRPYAVTASKLRQAAAQRHADDRDVRAAARELLQRAEFAGALLIDDIGKGASTPAGDEALYDLLNERRDHRRVTYWTANGGGAWLMRRLGKDLGPAITRRLADLAGGKAGGRLFVERGEEVG